MYSVPGATFYANMARKEHEHQARREARPARTARTGGAGHRRSPEILHASMRIRAGESSAVQRSNKTPIARTRQWENLTLNQTTGGARCSRTIRE